MASRSAEDKRASGFWPVVSHHSIDHLEEWWCFNSLILMLVLWYWRGWLGRFVEYPEDTTWMEANLFDGDSSEHRWSIVDKVLVIFIVIVLTVFKSFIQTKIICSPFRIPFDVLDSTEAETVYKNLLNQLNAEQNRIEWVVCLSFFSRKKMSGKLPLATNAI